MGLMDLLKVRRVAPWTADDVPDQRGRTALITGANSGIGFEAARGLASKGARVVLACRSEARGLDAIERLREHQPDAIVELRSLDLGSLASVQAFAESFCADHAQLHLLVNNAGIMAPPRRTTEDGFEQQLGVNHLGHFALTGRLFDLLTTTPGARIVSLSSNAHKTGKMNFDDLMGEGSYNRWERYSQSKLANLLFTHELQRRMEAAGHTMIAVAAHPGWTSTNLLNAGPIGSSEGFVARLGALGMGLGQKAHMGALPTLYAATHPDVQGSDYIGPHGFAEMWGWPVKVESTSLARDPEAAARLWSVSETLTGVAFDLG